MINRKQIHGTLYQTLYQTLFLLAALTTPALADYHGDQTDHGTHAAHTADVQDTHFIPSRLPIGIMGGHHHHSGGWMLMTQVMLTDMQGLLADNRPVTETQVFEQYHGLPRQMTMLMPMSGLMYAPADWLTLMAMLPGSWMRMEHVGHHEGAQAMQLGGIGDLSLSAQLGNWVWAQQHLHLNLGLSLPTGQIDLSHEQQLQPYSMRLGSGSFDLVPGLTWTGTHGALGWGLQPLATLRLGPNSLGYRLGHRLQLNGWLSWQWTDWLNTSLRLQGSLWGNIDGADRRLDPDSQPGADPIRQAGQRLDLLLGVTLSPFSGQRFGLELGLPVYQSLSGPQLATGWQLIAGWDWAFLNGPTDRDAVLTRSCAESDRCLRWRKDGCPGRL